MAPPKKPANRFAVPDHLRGYFIVVIIVDHLSRWPSALALITGKAQLWVTAAEGFVAISGLLVGYVRGYKNRQDPLWDVSKKLLSRALLLYLWAVLASVGYVALLWSTELPGGAPGIKIEEGDWVTLITSTITLQYTFVWVYFLGLYALFLAAAPLAIWLLRKNLAWVLALISGGLMILGWQLDSTPLQWQFLFFIPAIVGYYLDPILAWWKGLGAALRRRLSISIVSLTAITMTTSILTIFYPTIVPGLAELNTLAPEGTMTLWRALLSFLWFTGFTILFWWGHRFISRFLGWLLIPIGTRSLTAYILHGLALVLISTFFTPTESLLINTALGIASVLLVWVALKIPNINKVIPR